MHEEAVVCVHGLWLSGFATGFWRTRFAQAGYSAVSFSYPSVRQSLKGNARQLAGFVNALPQRRIHLAGHSLGGILIAAMLEEQAWRLPGKELGRVVLVGSPFQGTYVGRSMSRLGLGRAALGRAVQDWMDGAPPEVPAGVELGVIAGNRPLGLGRLAAPGLPLPHDGTVSVAETHVMGAREHLTLPVSHTEMLMSARVTRQMLRFFEQGAFHR
ncbi:MAG TPA: alpha/beta hydrolase [Burkholderiales bacterium]